MLPTSWPSDEDYAAAHGNGDAPVYQCAVHGYQATDSPCPDCPQDDELDAAQAMAAVTDVMLHKIRGMR